MSERAPYAVVYQPLAERQRYSHVFHVRNALELGRRVRELDAMVPLQWAKLYGPRGHLLATWRWS